MLKIFKSSLLSAAIILCAPISPLWANQTTPSSPTGENSQQQLQSWQDGGFEIKSIPREGQPALWLDAIKLSSDVTTEISGFIAYTTVKQTFKNTTDQWVNGTFRFPLPDQAAIDGFEMLVGNKRIVGKVKEKQEAKRIFNEAVKTGKKAALLSQIRPNMFTSKVGNVAPGAVVAVEVTFITHAEQSGLEFTWRLPQAITPRYRRPQAEESVPDASYKNTQEKATQAFHTEHGFYKHPKNIGPTSNLNISLTAGKPVKKLISPSHDIAISQNGANYQINLRKEQAPANKDFILRWQLEPSTAPEPLFIKEETETGTYLLGMVLPPKADTTHMVIPPRNIQFIIDVSGSMHGASIEQAQGALLEAIDQLRPEDKFDIIKFNHDHDRLFGQTQFATLENLDHARRYITSLIADGGTEMMPALADALNINNTSRAREERPQILFLTDGAINYEDQMYKLVQEKLDTTRLFTVGVGYAPNGWFMRKAAEFGRGIHIQIDDPEKSSPALSKLFHNIASPSFQNLMLDTENNTTETYPTILPDLYGNRPAVFVAKTSGEGFTFRAKNPSGKNWALRINPASIPSGKGISKLWARKKIEAITDSQIRGQLAENEAKTEILKVALHHKIASKYTSFVAVEEKISRPQTTPVQDRAIAENLPKGMKLKGLQNAQFSAPQTATMKDLKLLTGFILLAFALAMLFWLRKGVRHEV